LKTAEKAVRAAEKCITGRNFLKRYPPVAPQTYPKLKWRGLALKCPERGQNKG